MLKMANGEAKNIQEVILQAIESLRRRKARPDLERICHTVERKYGKTDFDVAGELDRMVDVGTVIKVEYKGDTSYRDASNWCRSRGLQLNSNDATRSILSAIEKLTTLKNQEQQNAQQPDGAGQVNNHEIGSDKGQTPTGQQQSQSQEPVQCPGQGEGGDFDNISDDAKIRGATLSDVEKFFFESDPDTKFTRPYLDEALKREVDTKRLYLHTPSGKYVLAKFADENDNNGDEQLSTTGLNLSKTKTKRGGRPPAVKQKRKRFKKTHGPEWDEKPLVKTSSWHLKCDYCALPARCNKVGDREELLICKDCTLKVHPSCMKYSKELAERSRLSPWQCIDCKTCHVCSDAGDADTLLFCDSCDKGYHMACHTPSVEDKPLGKWVCEPCASEDMELGSVGTEVDSLASSESNDSCSLEDKKSDTKPCSESSGQLTPDAAVTPNQSKVANLPVQSSQSQQASSSGGKRAKVTKERHPTSWSLADVAAYLTERGFAEEALKFEEQEIDGNALLLLRRSDVLTGLSFKLGPALKIYKLVSDLQLFHARPHGVNGLNGFAGSPPAPPKSTSATNLSIAAPTTSARTSKVSKASTSATRSTQSPPHRKKAPSPSAKATANAKTSQRKKAPLSAKTSPSANPSSAEKIALHKKTLAATSPTKTATSSRAAPLANPSQSPNSKRSSASPKGSLSVNIASTSNVASIEGDASLVNLTFTVTKTSPRSKSPALAFA